MFLKKPSHHICAFQAHKNKRISHAAFHTLAYFSYYKQVYQSIYRFQRLFASCGFPLVHILLSKNQLFKVMEHLCLMLH